MTDEDRGALHHAQQEAQQASADVREMMASLRNLQDNLKDAQGRAQAAHAAYTTLWASMVRKYGREEVDDPRPPDVDPQKDPEGYQRGLDWAARQKP